MRKKIYKILLFISLALVLYNYVIIKEKQIHSKIISETIQIGSDIYGIGSAFGQDRAFHGSHVTAKVIWQINYPQKILSNNAFTLDLLIEMPQIRNDGHAFAYGMMNYLDSLNIKEPGDNSLEERNNLDKNNDTIGYRNSYWIESYIFPAIREKLQVKLNLAGAKIEPVGFNSMNKNNQISWSILIDNHGKHQGVFMPKIGISKNLLKARHFKPYLSDELDLKFTLNVEERSINKLKFILYLLGGVLALPQLFIYLIKAINWFKKRKKNKKENKPKIILPGDEKFK